MAFTSKLLVIANRTVDSAELFEALRARAGIGPIEVTLVAPSVRDPQMDERLNRAVRALGDAGVVAEGVRGDPDPMLALADVWDPRRFDEVVVATLPGTTSRWLAVNLPKRVERYTGAQVTHVVAQPSPASAISDDRSEPSLRR